MVEALRSQGTTVIYTTHYMEEAERLCDRIAIVDHGRVIALAARKKLVAQSFGGRSDVLYAFARSSSRTGRNGLPRAAARWRKAWGTSRWSGPPISRGCWTAAARDGLEVIDVTLRRPNLESVFLQLTGRGLRQ